MMEEVKLIRTDKRPLVFIGEEIYNGSTKTQEGPTSTRWEVVRVFRLKDGGFIVGHARLTCWAGERDHYDAMQYDSAEKVIRFARTQLHYPLKEEITTILSFISEGGQSTDAGDTSNPCHQG